MWKMQNLAIAALLAVLVSGCSKTSTETSATPAGNEAVAPADSEVAQSETKLEAPAAAAQEFLEALRTGNDEKASAMLTSVAREKTASLNRNVTPPASDTAKFSVGKVDYINNDGARVACTWTDLDEEGQPKTDVAIWVLRCEEGKWRIAGVAAQVFPGEAPLLLNFEDPEDMFRKQQWVREEIRRRIESGDLQAKGTGKKENPIRR